MDDINPIYNISSDPAKQNWPLIELQELLDGPDDLNQLGFLCQMPGFRMNDAQTDRLAEIIVDFYLEEKAAGRLPEQQAFQTDDTLPEQTPSSP